MRDLERTLAFYQSIFGMQVMYLENDMLQLTTPGCHDVIVFEKSLDEEIQTESGIMHFGFRLREPDQMEAIFQKAQDAGAHVLSRGEFVPGSPYIFIKDPDGYTVEIWYELV